MLFLSIFIPYHVSFNTSEMQHLFKNSSQDWSWKDT